MKYLDLTGLAYFKTKILGVVSENINTATLSFINNVKLEDKKINFYHGPEKVAEIDAAPFYVDGMLENAEITTGTNANDGKKVLKLTFNTDAGKSAIEIPISDIFNPDNYYTKGEVDGKFTSELADYVKEEDLDGKLEDYAKSDEVESKIDEKLEDYAKSDEVESRIDEKLEGYAKESDLTAISISEIEGMFAEDY